MPGITFIDQVDIRNTRVLLRVDFNLSLDAQHHIGDDTRLQKTLPTIKYLLDRNNKLVLATHLGNPQGVDERYSLTPVIERLKQYISLDNITVLDNLRFATGETENSDEFAKELASHAEVYVNDAFGVCHRSHASIVGVPKYLPSYGGLLIKKELEMIEKITDNPAHPFIAIVGGVKAESKAKFIDKLLNLVDRILLGSGMVHAFPQHEKIIFPEDVVKDGEKVLDIGPETEAVYGRIIQEAKTILWTGPVGQFENPAYRRGTDFIYYAIAKNENAFSIVGGGDTLSAISKKEHLEKITHISTGGSALLVYIEKGTLPGLVALTQPLRSPSATG